jgi:hypothetical protein
VSVVSVGYVCLVAAIVLTIVIHEMAMHQILAPFAFSHVSRYMLNVTPLLDSLQGRNSYTLVLLNFIPII